MTTFGRLEQDGTKIDKVEIDLSKVPSNDPIAFMFGYMEGRTKRKDFDAREKLGGSTKLHGSKFRELAQEYLRGFLFGWTGILVPEGTKIKNGQEASYALFELNILKTDTPESFNKLET